MVSTWGIGSGAPKSVRRDERPLKIEGSPESDRAYFERNCIALLSNFEKPAIDPSVPELARASVRRTRHTGVGAVEHESR
jgi:hypothetical protein